MKLGSSSRKLVKLLGPHVCGTRSGKRIQYFCAWFYVQQILLKSKHSMKELFMYSYIYIQYIVCIIYNRYILLYWGVLEWGYPKWTVYNEHNEQS